MNVDVYSYLRVRQREVAPIKLHRSTDFAKIIARYIQQLNY